MAFFFISKNNYFLSRHSITVSNSTDGNSPRSPFHNHHNRHHFTTITNIPPSQLHHSSPPTPLLLSRPPSPANPPCCCQVDNKIENLEISYIQIFIPTTEVDPYFCIDNRSWHHILMSTTEIDIISGVNDPSCYQNWKIKN